MSGTLTVTCSSQEDYENVIAALANANATANNNGTTPPFSNTQENPETLVITFDVNKTGTI